MASLLDSFEVAADAVQGCSEDAPDKAIVRVDFADGAVLGSEAIEIALEAMRLLAPRLRERDVTSTPARAISL
jgi:hypothetical protein